MKRRRAPFILTTLAVAGLAGCAPAPESTVPAGPALPDAVASPETDPQVAAWLTERHAEASTPAGRLKFARALQANGFPRAAAVEYAAIRNDASAPAAIRAPAAFHAGDLAVDAGDVSVARRAYAEAAALAPGHIAPVRGLGALELDAGAFDAARTHWNHALAIDPNDAIARIGSARTALAADAPTTALTLLDPVQTEPWASHLLARALRAAGRGAEADARPAVPPPPPDDDWHRALDAERAGYAFAMARLRALVDAGRAADALVGLRNLVDKHPENVTVRTTYGVALRDTSDAVGAAAAFDAALDQRPSFVPALFHRGVLRAQTGAFAAAADDARRVLELNPSYAPAHGLTGDLALQNGAVADAIDAYVRAGRCAPDDPRWPKKGAIALLRAGEPGYAIAPLEAALRLDDTDGEAWTMLAVAQLSLGDLDAAEAAYAEAQVHAPDDPRLETIGRGLARLRAEARP